MPCYCLFCSIPYEIRGHILSFIPKTYDNKIKNNIQCLTTIINDNYYNKIRIFKFRYCHPRPQLYFNHPIRELAFIQLLSNQQNADTIIH